MKQVPHQTRFDEITIDRIGGRQPAPAHGTVWGKALLDFLPPDQIQTIPATELETVTARIIILPETLRQQVAEMRRRGHAIEIPD